MLTRLPLRSLLIGAVALAGALPAGASGPVDCERCHGSREFLAGKGGDAASDRALLVSRDDLAGTAHRSLACADCHRGYDDAWPHTDAALTVRCAECHEEVREQWAASSHGPGAEDGPDCRGCHGVHQVLGAENRASPVHPLNERGLCISCHSDHDDRDTVHGRARSEAGLVVAASCSDCHGAHLVLPSLDTASMTHRLRVPGTCGVCHTGVSETYAGGAHGRSLAKEIVGAEAVPAPAPVCTTCHETHGPAESGTNRGLATVERCAGCHEHAAETFRKSYHGKVSRLGGDFAAQCSDCHGAHDNLPPADPASSVHPRNLVRTCGACHALASASFVRFQSHADPHDREGFPVLFWTWTAMSALMFAVFGFFGVHTLMWLGRSLWRPAGPESDADDEGGPAPPAAEAEGGERADGAGKGGAS